MDKIDLGEKLPFGFCADCLARMARGAHYASREIAEGTDLVHAYCSHREVGATIVLRPGRPLRWNILGPIDALEWQQHVELKASMLAGVLHGIPGTAATEQKVAETPKELVQ